MKGSIPGSPEIHRGGNQPRASPDWILKLQFSCGRLFLYLTFKGGVEVRFYLAKADMERLLESLTTIDRGISSEAVLSGFEPKETDLA